MTTFDQFDGQGRPTAGVDNNGQHFVISYDGSGDATWKFDNGDQAVLDPGGKPVREITGGTTFDRFDDQRRPVDGTDSSQHHFTITYDGSGNATWKFDNGDVTVLDPGGKPVRELVGGTKFDQFDGQNRPVDGIDKNGQHFIITYDQSGDATWKFDNGDVTVLDPGGKPVRELVGGTKFDQFDGQNRPVDGIDKNGQHFIITYDQSGDATWKFDNGDQTVLDPGGKPVRELVGGTKFDQFDGQNRPVDGIDKNGQHFIITYDQSGDATWKFDNGDQTVLDPGGKPVREVVGGTTFTKFDDQGRPVDGIDKNGQHFIITYDQSGDATWKFDNGDQTVLDPGGKPVREVVGGTTFTKFDDQGRPVDGIDKNGQHFIITYDQSGDATWKFDNGDQTVLDPGGKPVREVVGGTTFTKFDDQGRPTAGVDKNGQPFTITYDGNGDVFTHYGDGTTTETGPNGNLIKTWLPNGTEIDWAVDLPALNEAIVQVSYQRGVIGGEIQTVRSTFNNVEDHWQSPSGNSFVVATTSFNSVTDNLMAVLDEAISRMKIAYQNYISTEAANTKNLQ